MRKVIVRGIAGNMGQQAAQTVIDTDGFELKAGLDKNKIDGYISDMPDIQDGPEIKIESELEKVLTEKEELEIMIDFTTAKGLLEAGESAVKHGLDLIIGTTGLNENDRKKLAKLSEEHNQNILLAPNFSLGAVLLMELAETASEFFPRVEIIEGHHEGKDDAPSGTSIATAEKLKNCQQLSGEEDIEFTVEGVRGGEVENVKIHSLRLPGLMAEQEVILGGESQTLSLQHRAIDRAAFRPGIRLALNRIDDLSGFVYGLENLL